MLHSKVFHKIFDSFNQLAVYFKMHYCIFKTLGKNTPFDGTIHFLQLWQTSVTLFRTNLYSVRENYLFSSCSSLLSSFLF